MPDPWGEWAAKALVPTVEAAVSTEPCPAYGYASDNVTACFDPNTDTIHLSGPDTFNRAQFFHEIGHAFDIAVMTDAHRAGFIRIMRYRTSSWTAANTAGESAMERFASAYSVCARRREISRDGHKYGPGHGYGYAPTLAQHRRVCALIRRAATSGRTPGPR